MKPTILKATCDPLADQPFEIVERKGLGHPDTICDAVMEQVAVELAQAYLKMCGHVLHFNADKGLLVAGQVDCHPGGGHVITPMRLVMGDRATFEWRKKRVPVNEIAERVASTWFRQHLPHVDPLKHLTCQVELKPASAELQSVSERRGGPVANDTSAAVGYAPFTLTERLVFQVEQFLNSSSFKKAFPDSGQDVKVLGVRTRGQVTLTVAMPLLASAIRTESQYFARKAEVLPLWTVYPAWGWGTEDSAKALGYLKRFGSVTVLNGHIHQVMQKVEGNVTFHTARSTAFPQPAPGTAPSPGPMKVPADQLEKMLGIASVTFKQNEQRLAIVDRPLKS